MASYDVALAKHATLSANTADAVTVHKRRAEVKNRHATADIYFTVDSGTPTPGDDNTYIVGPGESLLIDGNPDANPTVVRLVSTSAAPYSVTGVD